jgi:hypothetical protein
MPSPAPDRKAHDHPRVHPERGPIPHMSVDEVGEALSWGAMALSRATSARTSTPARWWTGVRAVP